MESIINIIMDVNIHVCVCAGVKEQDFSWPAYIKQWKAQAAPKALFDNHNTVNTDPRLGHTHITLIPDQVIHT